MEKPKCKTCNMKMEQQYLGDDKIWVCPECGLDDKGMTDYARKHGITAEDAESACQCGISIVSGASNGK